MNMAQLSNNSVDFMLWFHQRKAFYIKWCHCCYPLCWYC